MLIYYYITVLLTVLYRKVAKIKKEVDYFYKHQEIKIYICLFFKQSVGGLASAFFLTLFLIFPWPLLPVHLSSDWICNQIDSKQSSFLLTENYFKSNTDLFTVKIDWPAKSFTYFIFLRSENNIVWCFSCAGLIRSDGDKSYFNNLVVMSSQVELCTFCTL